ncbi:hypothetical protein GOODEAATRI_032352, partial [Goodea atripinnis]
PVAFLLVLSPTACCCNRVLTAFFLPVQPHLSTGSWTVFVVRPVRLPYSRRTVMTCALPALVLTISGRCFQIMPALIAAFCPERCGWPGCPRWSSLLTGRSLSSRIRCRLDRVRPPRNGLLKMCPWHLGGEPSGEGPRDCPLEWTNFLRSWPR